MIGYKTEILFMFKFVIPVLARRSASARRRENGNPDEGFMDSCLRRNDQLLSSYKDCHHMAFIPSYLSLFEKGELSQRVQVLQEFLKECRLCPRECQVNRLDGEIGYCKAFSEMMGASAFH